MSKSLRNVLTSLAMIEQMVGSLRKNYQTKAKNRTIMKLTDRAIKSSQEAMQCWPGQIDASGLKKVKVRVGTFEKKYGETIDFVFFSSVALGILSDILRNIKDAMKRAGIEGLIYAVMRIHRYFDRDFKKNDVYHEAATAIQYWHSLEA